MEEETSLKIGVKRYIFNASIRERRKELGLSQRDLVSKSNVTITRLAKFERLQDIPTPDEADRIADVLGVPAVEVFPPSLYKKIVERLNNISLHYYFDVTPMSLCNQEIYQLESSVGSMKDLEADIDRKIVLEKYLGQLQDREKQILELRFGLDGNISRTLEETGKFFGVTRERVRQMERKAIKKLKKLLVKDGLNLDNILS